jgi:acetylornithine deacetylase/succinyl-diaminopimelate desuccinylase-like protein
MHDQNFPTDRRTLLKGAAAGAMMLGAGPVLAAPAERDLVQKAAESGYQASVKRIQDWIKLPSIAAEDLNMQEGADYMMRLARDAGFQHVEKVPSKGHPGVFATLDAGAKRWMGIYFMYDVKQFDAAEWTSPPLEARIVDKPGWGKAIVGRGAVNQKGPQAAFLAALHAFKAAGKKLPVNLVLVAEGEEEIGSPNFAEIVRRPHVLAALKKCEGVIIPSGWQAADGSVEVNLGAKGIVELELVASGEKWGKGPSKDIHSSNKVIVDSPAWRLVAALSTLVSPDGNTPAIDGFFEKVRPLTPREREIIAANAASSSSEAMMKTLGIKSFAFDEPWVKTLERRAGQPTVNIEGLVSGYTGPGGKTILPSRAVAKIDMRLVPNMTRDDTVRKLRAHLDKRGFGDVEVNVSGGYDPTETDENSRVIRAQQAVYTRSGVKHTLYPRLAGSWPGFVFTSAPVSLPAGQFGLGHGSGAHAPDEYFVIESSNLKVKGLVGATMGFVDFLYEMASVK